MKQEKVGTEEKVFFDSYALFAIAIGQESYKPYIKIKIVTTIMNLYEMYYILLQENHYLEAEIFFDKFLQNCILIEPHLVKEAAQFRMLHKKLKFSYVDALGYICAKELGVPFLTGDDGFRNFEHVLFVK
ncbi:PIN domain-containing protein [Candidatus Woesearchaeota archaeon]|nr:PIN domain-containing protein [Candidatus Woesearchaeota archaeon]